MSPDEQTDDTEKTAIRQVPDTGSQPTSVSNKVVAGESPADAQRKAEGLPPREGTTPPDQDVGGPSDTGSARTWAPAGGESPATAQQRGADAASDPFNDRPHVWVAAAFVGGLVFAQVLKRLGGGDDD